MPIRLAMMTAVATAIGLGSWQPAIRRAAIAAILAYAIALAILQLAAWANSRNAIRAEAIAPRLDGLGGVLIGLLCLVPSLAAAAGFGEPRWLQTIGTIAGIAVIVACIALASPGKGTGKQELDEAEAEADFDHDPGFISALPKEKLIRWLLAQLGSVSILLGWRDGDTPWAVEKLAGGALVPTDLPVAMLAPVEAETPGISFCLIDAAEDLAVQLDARGRLQWTPCGAFALAGAAQLHAPRLARIGIVTPTRSIHLLYALDWRYPRAALARLSLLANDMTAAAARFDRLERWRGRLLAEARMLLSRDMHDSVLQTLAALRMHVAALAAPVAPPQDMAPAPPADQLAEIDDIIVGEQRRIRSVLAESRLEMAAPTLLFAFLDRRITSLARLWNVRCAIRMQSEDFAVPEETAIECELLLREAVANAVQHGHARSFGLVLAREEAWLFVTLQSDGVLHGPRARTSQGHEIAVESRSLEYRVERLGGHAYAEPTNSGSLLSIRIPLERH